MVYGIGTDLQHVSALNRLSPDDPFYRSAFTGREREEAEKRTHPADFYAERFAVKEAVVKAFGIDTNRVRVNEIETLDDEFGVPRVILHGAMRALAENRGIKAVLISLSCDQGIAIAFALLSNEAVEQKEG